MPLNQVAAISVDDAKTIRVAPWDATQIKAVEKAISALNLGVSVGVDERGVRVVFPELTSERRVMLLKLAKDKLEQARVTLRGHRGDAIKSIEAAEKEGGMGEDNKFRYKEDLQKMVNTLNLKLEEIYERKEKEINN